MTNNVIIAGSIAAACTGLALVAFLAGPTSSRGAQLAAETPGLAELPAQPDPFNTSTPQLGPGLSDPPPVPDLNRDLPQRGGSLGTRPAHPPRPPDGVTPPPIAETPTPPEPTGPDQPQTHAIASGETLGEISLKYYGSSKHWREIKTANPGLDEANMQVGRKLTIPVLAPAAAVEVGAGERSYTVQKNDTYFSIARSQLGDVARWKDLEKLNHLPAEALRPGKVIKLPVKAAEPAPPAPTAVDDGRVHVVAKGETLGEISQKYYGTTRRWKDIQKANPKVDAEAMIPGTRLVLPDAPTVAAPALGDAPTSAAPAPAAPGEYVVVAGDGSLMDIARKTLVNPQQWKVIQDANPGINARRLRIGQKLLIPGYAGGSAATPPTAAAPLEILPPPLDTPTLAPSPRRSAPGASTAFAPVFEDSVRPGNGELFGRSIP